MRGLRIGSAQLVLPLLLEAMSFGRGCRRYTAPRFRRRQRRFSWTLLWEFFVQIVFTLLGLALNVTATGQQSFVRPTLMEQ